MPLPPRPRLSQIQSAVVDNRSSCSQPPELPSRTSDPTTVLPEVTPVSERLRTLEPADPPLITILDPVFNTADAATILGVTPDRLEKWRQRAKGPNYLQYERYGHVRYELNALNAFKASHRIRPSRERRGGRRREQ